MDWVQVYSPPTPCIATHTHTALPHHGHSIVEREKLALIGIEASSYLPIVIVIVSNALYTVDIVPDSLPEVECVYVHLLTEAE